jgi:hypothetical protein
MTHYMTYICPRCQQERSCHPSATARHRKHCPAVIEEQKDRAVLAELQARPPESLTTPEAIRLVQLEAQYGA